MNWSKKITAILVTLCFCAVAVVLPSSAETGDISYEVTLSEAMPLPEKETLLYEALKDLITQTANGSRPSTDYVVDMEDLGGAVSFTAETEQQAAEGAMEQLNLDFYLVKEKLFFDLPFELYWFDHSASVPGTMKTEKDHADGFCTVTITHLEYRFPVSADYAASRYEVDPEKAQKAQQSLVEIQAILSRYQDVSDFEKLMGYKEEICARTSYSTQAEQGSLPYGDPWQLTGIFGKEDAVSVGEGYAKAFQYLCDRTDFDADITCRLIEGTICTEAAEGEHAHVWNLVRMDDRRNYLVDIANCDDGRPGKGNKLFLAGVGRWDDTGNEEECYTYYFASEPIIYRYDRANWERYGAENLELSGCLYYGPLGEWKIYEEEGVSYELYTDIAVAISASVTGETLRIPEEVSDRRVTQIWPGTLSSDSSLRFVEIPASVTEMDAFDFINCPALEEIRVAEGNPRYQSQDGVLFEQMDEGRVLRLLCYPATKSCERYTVPEAVIEIAREAMAGSAGELVLGKNVETIDGPEWMRCEKITVDAENEMYSSQGGILYSKDGTELLLIPCDMGGEAVIRDGVLFIRQPCMLGSRISKLVIPGSVQLMESDCFSNLKQLETVFFDEGVTEIGRNAFAGCEALSQVQLPDSLVSIDAYAFEDCSLLSDILLPEHLESLGDQTFYNTAIDRLTIPKNVQRIGDAFTGGEDGGVNELIFQGDFPSLIAENAFELTSGLTVYYPENKNGWTEEVRTDYGGTDVVWIPYEAEEDPEVHVHDYQFEGWQWSDDLSNASALFVCRTDATHQLRKTVSVTTTQLPPSCVKDGAILYDAYLEFEGVSYTDRRQSVIPAAHTPGEMTIENRVEPTADAEGSYEEVIRCDVCGEELSKHLVMIPKLPHAASITLDRNAYELRAGKFDLSLHAAILPENAGDKQIIWKSSDPSVASVDQNGVVKALAYGKTVITATLASNPKLSASCRIQVWFDDVFYNLNGTSLHTVDKETFTAVYWLADQKITGEKVHFGVNSYLTRGQYVRFLYRYAGNPKVTNSMIKKYGSRFKDVDKNYTHYKAIIWAVSKGLIGGYSDGTFRPNKKLTRNNVATILYKLAGSPKVNNPTNPFFDVKKSAAISWGKQKKIFTGANGMFMPSEYCIRGDIALFLYRYDRYVK